MLNKAIQEICVKKKAAVEARDHGAITDTERFVRIMAARFQPARPENRTNKQS